MCIKARTEAVYRRFTVLIIQPSRDICKLRYEKIQNRRKMLNISRCEDFFTLRAQNARDLSLEGLDERGKMMYNKANNMRDTRMIKRGGNTYGSEICVWCSRLRDGVWRHCSGSVR
jgi:hypothetical protein